MNLLPPDVEIRDALIRALEWLIEDDVHLFAVGTSERSMTFRLGLHLQDEVDDDWRVDSEYNRNGEFPKRLLEIKSHRLAADPNSESEGDVYPDLIVHHRGHDGPNRLAVETKKATEQTRTNTEFDYLKLREYRNALGYGTVAFVVFDNDKNGPFAKVFFDLEEREFIRVPPSSAGSCSSRKAPISTLPRCSPEPKVHQSPVAAPAIFPA